VVVVRTTYFLVDRVFVRTKRQNPADFRLPNAPLAVSLPVSYRYYTLNFVVRVNRNYPVVYSVLLWVYLRAAGKVNSSLRSALMGSSTVHSTLLAWARSYSSNFAATRAEHAPVTSRFVTM